MVNFADVSWKTGFFDLAVISCEHAVNRIPHEFSGNFIAAGAVLKGHRGYDPGALEAAEFMAARLYAPLFSGEWSRLLVDLNRSSTNRRLFSEYTTGLDETVREKILQCYYHPYRNGVTAAVGRAVACRKKVLHLGIHSFTPVLDGVVRNATVGLLYDPARAEEKNFCGRVKAELLRRGIATRCNYPYRGSSDGLTSTLRRTFVPEWFCGIEIELNQKVWFSSRYEWQRLTTEVFQAIVAGAGISL